MIIKYAIILSIFVGATAFAENIPRVYFGARLEPIGNKILHGAGQSSTDLSLSNYTDSDAFTSYSAVVPKTKPAVFMTCIQLSKADPNWGKVLRSQLEKLSSNLIIPHICLSMISYGPPRTHFEDRVATGKYDKEIQIFCNALKDLQRPAFVRIGYEFNGKWNGYAPSSYVAAFRRISRALHASGLNEVATVWDYSPDQSDVDYMSFYPGDAFVDWWAINLFGTPNFVDTVGEQFLRDSMVHRKPVMIAESTPRYNGVTKGIDSWNKWFVPYFSYIDSHPNIKSFNYVNWDWAKHPVWANWGDAQIQDSPVIRKKYSNELQSNSQFLNQMNSGDLRKAIGLH